MIDIPGYDQLVVWRAAEGPIVEEKQEGYYVVARNARGEMVETRSLLPKQPEPKR